jgi:hypothetical protein
MTTITFRRSSGITCFVTTGAGSFSMRSCQWVIGGVVIKDSLGPVGEIMTKFAIFRKF